MRFLPLAGVVSLAISFPALADPAADSADDTAIGTVVITGEKLQRTELDTTASVGLRSGRQLEESSVRTLEDAVSRMANVATSHGLTIRGVPLYGPTGGDAKTATITVDGVLQEGFGTDLTQLSIWDAEQVEVLRGPQSTNQGRNALAGAVVLKSRDPTDEWDVRGRAIGGNDGTWRGAVAGGGSIVDDVAAFRLSYEGYREDGGVYNETLRDDRWNYDDGYTVRGKLRLTPFGENYKALLTLVDEEHKTGDPYVEITLRDRKDRASLANVPSDFVNRIKSAAFEQTFSLGKVDFTLLSTYAENRYDRSRDYDETELNQGVSSSLNKDKPFTQEARGAFNTTLFGNQLKGVIGLYYSDTPSHYTSDFLVPVSYVLTIFGICPDQATCDQLYPDDFVTRRNLDRFSVRNHAVFGEADYKIGAFTFTAGGRYDKEKQGRGIGSATSGNTPTAAAVVDQLIEFGQVAPDGDQNLSTEYSAWLPKLGARYNLADAWVLGAVWQRGYRTGGVSYSYQRGPKQFAPEYTDNYELSLKGELLPRTILALSVYEIDWKDQQVDVSSNFLDTFIVNAGRSRLRGAELELRGHVLPQLEVFGALGIARTKYLDFDSPQGDFSGNQFAMSPRDTWSLGATWKPASWMINAELVHEAGTFTTASNDPDLATPGHTLFNARLGYQLRGMDLFAYGRNLTDETYETYVLDTVPGRQAAVLGAGRQFGLGFEAHFQAGR
ncbi:MAG: TonB-dependent receptor [Gammaproteobacteria bacterium]